MNLFNIMFNQCYGVKNWTYCFNKLECFELFTESMKIDKFKLIVNFNNQWEKHKHYGINSSSF